MRILHSVLSLDMGGAHLSAVNIACGLKNLEHDVYLSFSSHGSRENKTHPILRERLIEAGVRLITLNNLVREPNPRMDIAAFIEMLEVVRRLKPQVINTHSAKPGLMMGIISRILGVPLMIHTVRGFTHEKTRSRSSKVLYLALERLTANLADRLVAVSPVLAEINLEKRIGEREKFSVIRSGVDIAEFKQFGVAGNVLRTKLGIPHDAPVVGSVSALVPEKGVLDLARAFVEIGKKRRDVYFIFVGDGPLRNTFLTTVRALGDRFKYLGMQSEMPPCYAAMDCFLLASETEGLPRVIIEALCAGLPIVATDAGATRELVRNMKTGFIVHVGDIRTLVEQTLVLLEDDDLRKKISENNAASIGKEFDTETVVLKYQQLYEENLRR